MGVLGGNRPAVKTLALGRQTCVLLEIFKTWVITITRVILLFSTWADDFESKFTFHTVEDFPPPDEYKPCQKSYPSKIPRSKYHLGKPLGLYPELSA